MILKRNQRDYHDKCTDCENLTGHSSGKCQKCRGNKYMDRPKHIVGDCALFQEQGRSAQVHTDHTLKSEGTT